MTTIIPVSIMPGTKVLRIEHVPTEQHWRIWTAANYNLTTGTYLKLHANGAMERVVLHEDGHEDYFTVKEPS